MSLLNVLQVGKCLEDTDSYSLLGTIKSKLWNEWMKPCLARQAPVGNIWGNFQASFHSSGSLLHSPGSVFNHSRLRQSQIESVWNKWQSQETYIMCHKRRSQQPNSKQWIYFSKRGKVWGKWGHWLEQNSCRHPVREDSCRSLYRKTNEY